MFTNYNAKSPPCRPKIIDLTKNSVLWEILSIIFMESSKLGKATYTATQDVGSI